MNQLLNHFYLITFIDLVFFLVLKMLNIFFGLDF